METDKILGIVAYYRSQLEAAEIPKTRMDIKKTGADLTQYEMLQHAHYLLDGVTEYAQNPEKVGKTGRHLASVQMFLLFAGWYTLEELMNHNRPRTDEDYQEGTGRTHQKFFNHPYKHY